MTARTQNDTSAKHLKQEFFFSIHSVFNVIRRRGADSLFDFSSTVFRFPDLFDSFSHIPCSKVVDSYITAVPAPNANERVQIDGPSRFLSFERSPSAARHRSSLSCKTRISSLFSSSNPFDGVACDKFMIPLCE